MFYLVDSFFTHMCSFFWRNYCTYPYNLLKHCNSLQLFSFKKEERDLRSLKSKSNPLSVVLLTAIPELGGGAVAN